MNYPLDVEVCVEVYKESEGSKDSNDIYHDGLHDSFTDVFESEVPKSYENELRERFGENYEKFLVQAKDAYKQGQADKVRNVTQILN